MPADADGFILECRERLELPIIGLMCVPPLDEEPAPHFALLREIARRNGLANPQHGHERRFREGDPLRRNPCPRRHRDLRRPRQRGMTTAALS